MKILMLCADWGVPLCGDAGSSVHLREMAAAFQSLGHEVRLVVANDSGENRVDLSVHTVPVRLYMARIQQAVAFLRGDRGDVSGELSVEMPTAISQGRAEPLMPPLSVGETPVSWKARLYYQTMPSFLGQWEELLFFRHRFAAAVSRSIAEWSPDFVYERYALGQTGGLAAARKAGLPLLLEVNAPLVDERATKYGLSKPLQALGRRDEKNLWSSADNIFCVSDALRDRAVSTGAQGARVRTLPNGVNCDVFSSERAKGKLRSLVPGENGILIGWLGSLSAGRGVEELLRMLPQVMEQVPAAHGVVIGGGSLMGECRALAVDLGIAKRVTFVGAVPHPEVPELLADLDIAVASYPPQKDFYFSPMKVYEYMACGLPVVAGAMGQMNDVIDNGTTGVLLPPDSAVAWSEALVELCRDPKKRMQIGNAARNAVVTNCSWRSNAETVVAVARSLIEARKGCKA